MRYTTDMESLELHSLAESIQKELKLAKKTSSSFPYIHTPLPPNKTMSSDELVQVFAVGGSVFKKALYQKTGSTIKMLSSSKSDQPTFSTKDDLFTFLLQEIDPHITKLAINFAYPLDPVLRDGRMDGVLMSGMKENRFEGLVGKKIGEELENEVMKLFDKKIFVGTANDTTCLLLSGLSQGTYESVAAGVMGTGLNFAFFSSQNEAINLEAANFDKFTQSEEGKIIDKNSTAPGKALIEKEVAGQYLYLHFNHHATLHNLPYHPLTSTVELNDLAMIDSGEGELARSLFKRSAQLSAALIAGIVLFRGRDLTFMTEGSLFWYGHSYKETVQKTLKELLPKNSIHFIKNGHSSLAGGLHLIP